MKKTRVTYRSYWEKGNKKCIVVSESQTLANGKLGKAKEFYFAGYNPFPCFSMMSTYDVVEKWMQDNGWNRTSGSDVTFITDEICDETGEVYYQSKQVYHYIPVGIDPSK